MSDQAIQPINNNHHHQQQNTPFENYSVWTLAGVDSDGVVYAASIDPILLDVNLWCYIGAQRRWKLLARSESISSIPAEMEHHCLLAAAYRESTSRVEVFVECAPGSVYLYGFSTSDQRLERVLVSGNTEEIAFDGITGPSLHFVSDHRLLIAGKTLGNNDLRVFEINFNDDDDGQQPVSFSLVQIWSGGFPDPNTPPRYAVIGDGRWFVMMGDRRFLLFSVPDQRGDRLHDPIALFSRWPVSEMEYDLYLTPPLIWPSPVHPDRFWFVPHADPIREIQLHDTDLNGLRQVRELDWGDSFSPTDSEGSTNNVVVASPTHLFWVEDNEETTVDEEIKSKCIAPPSLQFLCLESLSVHVPDIQRCETETEAMRLGIPKSAWRRFCR